MFQQKQTPTNLIKEHKGALTRSSMSRSEGIIHFLNLTSQLNTENTIRWFTADTDTTTHFK